MTRTRSVGAMRRIAMSAVALVMIQGACSPDHVLGDRTLAKSNLAATDLRVASETREALRMVREQELDPRYAGQAWQNWGIAGRGHPASAGEISAVLMTIRTPSSITPSRDGSDPSSQAEADATTYGTSVLSLSAGTARATTWTTTGIPTNLSADITWEEQISWWNGSSNQTGNASASRHCDGPSSSYVSCTYPFSGFSCPYVPDNGYTTMSTEHNVAWMIFYTTKYSSAGDSCHGPAPTVTLNSSVVAGYGTTAFNDCHTGGYDNWSSDAPSVATVNSTGLVMGVSAGTATITVDCFARTGSASITVTAPQGSCHTVSTLIYEEEWTADEGSCGGGGGSYGSGQNCSTEWISIEEDDGAGWYVVWQGYATICS